MQYLFDFCCNGKNIQLSLLSGKMQLFQSCWTLCSNIFVVIVLLIFLFKLCIKKEFIDKLNFMYLSQKGCVVYEIKKTQNIYLHPTSKVIMQQCFLICHQRTYNSKQLSLKYYNFNLTEIGDI